jgi:hypothetical protein
MILINGQFALLTNWTTYHGSNGGIGPSDAYFLNQIRTLIDDNISVLGMSSQDLLSMDLSGFTSYGELAQD